MYSNNILNFQESTTILNACTKIVWKFIDALVENLLSVWKMELVKRVQILAELFYVQFNPILLRPSLGKIAVQTGLSSLGKTTGLDWQL